MRRIIAAALAAMVMLLSAAGCSSEETGQSVGEEKLEIVASLFPQYDFARTVAGQRAEVTLLLPAGMESHSYDPTPADMAGIYSCDLFIYTGEYMEPWAAELSKGLVEEQVLDVSTGIELSGTHEHMHTDTQDGEEPTEIPDPHIWTCPLNAVIMVENIRDALIRIDPDGEEEYTENADGLIEDLNGLDAELREVVENGERRTLVFGGRFAFHYLAEEYGLECYSAYDSCTAETEPSAAAVAEVTEIVRRDEIPVVYYEEFANPQVAEAIADETGAELLMLHSCHNLSQEERDAGKSYLSIMEQNVENIRRGLN